MLAASAEVEKVVEGRGPRSKPPEPVKNANPRPVIL